MAKKMKNALLMVLSFVLVAALAIGGTVAYLTSEDSDVNVMTLGNVKIEQHEYERVQDADGTYSTGTVDNQTSYILQGFTQAKPLLPIVGDPSEPGDSPAYAGWDETTVRMSQVDSYGGMQVFAGKNAQDKFVTVENTGKTDAYIRTIIAIEIGSTDGALIGTSYHSTWKPAPVGTIEIDGTNYMVTEYAYVGGQLSDGSWRHKNGVLPAGDTSYPNLSQVYLKHKATNEDMVAIDGNGNGTLDILVLSQAVQADGFSDAQTALDTAFGKVSEKAAEWFGGVAMPEFVNTADELQAALDSAENGDTIILGADITGDVTVTQKSGVKFTIDGNGKTFDGSITVDGKSSRYETAGVVIKNVKFASGNTTPAAYINLGNGDTNTRYTNNVTVSDCTFGYNGTGDKVAIKSYTGGDWNLTIEGCTVASGMHSLVQVANVEKGLTITDCQVYSKNGINLNNTPYLNMSGCQFTTSGYAVRIGVNGATNSGTFTIADSELKSSNEEGDAVIILRGTMTGATLTLKGTTLTGTPDISGEAIIVR